MSTLWHNYCNIIKQKNQLKQKQYGTDKHTYDKKHH